MVCTGLKRKVAETEREEKWRVKWKEVKEGKGGENTPPK